MPRAPRFNAAPFAPLFLALLAAALLAPAARAGTPPPEQADPGDFRAIINRAKEKVFPAVVFLMPIAERFEDGKREQAQVSGSGVIIDPSGLAVTNWHVVDKSIAIRCLLSDGSVGQATVLGTDKDTDTALLRLQVPGVTEYPTAVLGDSDRVVEGEFVMAMGAPWGMSRSVSLGILSCATRFLDDTHTGGYNLWLQTDASINPGNSGGPLVNSEGEVIGINTLGMIFGGNMAFAVPSNVVKDSIRAIGEHGRVIRAWTGLRLQPLKDFERDIFYPGPGVLVGSVDDGSPADAAGLRAGDLVLSVNGEPVGADNREELPAVNRRLADLPLDREAVFAVRRPKAAPGEDESEAPDAADMAGGESLEIRFVPLEKGRVEGEDFDCRQWNMTVKAINEFANPNLAFFRKAGVYIQGVKFPGNAAHAGLQLGDILLTVDGKDISTLDELRAAYREIVADEAREKKLRVTVLRAGLTSYAVIDYAARYDADGPVARDAGE